MPNGDPRDGFFYPTLTFMIDSYIMSPEATCIQKELEVFSEIDASVHHLILACVHASSACSEETARIRMLVRTL